MKVYIEQQYDFRRNEVRSQATTDFGPGAYRVTTRGINSVGQANEVARQFVQMYRDLGAEVVT